MLTPLAPDNITKESCCLLSQCEIELKFYCSKAAMLAMSVKRKCSL